MDRLDQESLRFIMATRMTGPLVRRFFEHKRWFPVEDGYLTGSFLYQAKGWSKPRKIVVVRKDKTTRPDTGGKLLFPDIEEFDRYKYAAFITNIEFSNAMIWQLYNQRADCENRIRELKYDYGIEGFCMEDFYATEAAFRWTMVAHNLMKLIQVTGTLFQAPSSIINNEVPMHCNRILSCKIRPKNDTEALGKTKTTTIFGGNILKSIESITPVSNF